jgi:hypothetical protein
VLCVCVCVFCVLCVVCVCVFCVSGCAVADGWVGGGSVCVWVCNIKMLHICTRSRTNASMHTRTHTFSLSLPPSPSPSPSPSLPLSLSNPRPPSHTGGNAAGVRSAATGQNFSRVLSTVTLHYFSRVLSTVTLHCQYTRALTCQTLWQLVRAQVTRAKLRAETIARRAPLPDAAAGVVWAGEDSDPVLRARSHAVGLSGLGGMKGGGGGGAGGLVGRWGGDCYGPGLQDTLAEMKLSAARPRVLWVWGVGCGFVCGC